ncbi:hypothetical protein V5799_033762 [Amblyomma americanum]|uniref:Uncharacterized protein n=1 Tax=Amblyomma americanum TaxID=6943 RepID=A0AAQ4DMD9_AMBAM
MRLSYREKPSSSAKSGTRKRNCTSAVHSQAESYKNAPEPLKRSEMQRNLVVNGCNPRKRPSSPAVPCVGEVSG